MLDKFLEVTHKQASARHAEHQLVDLLMQLPSGELAKLAAGGMKLANYDCGPEWVEQFKGTALFEKAVAIEQEDLQLELAEQQKRQQHRMEDQNDPLNAQRDQLRLKRRLLQLELLQQEAGAAAQPDGNAQPGVPSIPMGGAQGAGGLGPEAGAPELNKAAAEGDKHGPTSLLDRGAEHVGRGLGHVGAYAAPIGGMLAGGYGGVRAGGHVGRAAGESLSNLVKHPALKGLIAGAVEGVMTGLGGVTGMSAGLHAGGGFREGMAKEHGKIQDRVRSWDAENKEASARFAWAENVGRELARADFAKVARSQDLLEQGTEAGRVFAKMGMDAAVLKGLGAKALSLAKAHPGAAMGLAGGALTGMRPDAHGETHLLRNMAVGGLAGHAAENIGTSMQSGTPFGAAAKQYAKGWGNKLQSGAAAAGLAPPTA